ncbi:MAG: hypothetical protein WC337_06970 [Candidatus Muiribacteriota bacterium]
MISNFETAEIINYYLLIFKIPIIALIIINLLFFTKKNIKKILISIFLIISINFIMSDKFLIIYSQFYLKNFKLAEELDNFNLSNKNIISYSATEPIRLYVFEIENENNENSPFFIIYSFNYRFIGIFEEFNNGEI